MAQGVVLLLKINELNAKLNGSAVYFSLDCTSGYHHLALSPEAPKQSAFFIVKLLNMGLSNIN